MLINTSELKDAALDWAVAVASTYPVVLGYNNRVTLPHLRSEPEWFQPTIDWRQAGQIIEREWESICTHMDVRDTAGTPIWMKLKGRELLTFFMRCFVASKLGEAVDVPKELCK